MVTFRSHYKGSIPIYSYICLYCSVFKCSYR